MTAVLPRWDLTPFFPSIEDRSVTGAVEEVGPEVTRLVGLYDEHDVRGGAARPVDAAAVTAFEAVVAATEALRERLRLVTAYVAAHVDTDAGCDRASARQAELQVAAAPLRALAPRFAAWVASLGAEGLIAATPVAAELAWPLRKAEAASRHQLSEAEEALAAELWLSGGSAWLKLHGEVSAGLEAEVQLPTGPERLPITVVRNLAGDPDPAVRRAAHEAEVAAWRTVEVPLAAALNGVKGETSVLNRRRGWPDDLAPALHHNAVDRPTLEALNAAVRASLPDFRRYLLAKAARLGGTGPLAWWDLLAPLGDPSAAAVTWDEARAAVERAFSAYSPSLHDLARRAFAESWIDAGPHAGKRGGAYCMSFREGESRVFMNFAGTADSVSTLAHELGHAYHNATLAGRSQLQRQTPMALAETASIFCETVLVDAWLEGVDDRQRLMVLDTDLTGSTQVVVDIHSRFLFESRLFERRSRRPLAPAELCLLMVEAQQEAYGEAIDPATLHPYMWAVKPHYYATSFYNWPYTFGLLFALGLYARFGEDPQRFRSGYDDLLSCTGLAPAAELASRFGIDVHDEGFWASSLAVCRERIRAFCALAGD